MITVNKLVKKYGSQTALRDVSFKAEKGNIYGLLGPNGAGKSTTMNIMAGCLAATSGTVVIDGHDIFDDPIGAKRCMGYLPEQPPLYGDMTPLEYLRFVGEAKKIPEGKLDKELEKVIIKTGIKDVLYKLCDNLSKGYKQRVGIAQALLGDPEFIILDEPTVGLDPIQIQEIRQLIKSLSEGHTVIFSSHILSEVSALCDYLFIISHGRIVADGTLDGLTENYESGNRILRVESRGDADTISDSLKKIQGIVSIKTSYDGGNVVETLESAKKDDIRNDVFHAYVSIDTPILSMTSNQATLEYLFTKLIDEDNAEFATETENEKNKFKAKKKTHHIDDLKPGTGAYISDSIDDSSSDTNDPSDTSDKSADQGNASSDTAEENADDAETDNKKEGKNK